MANAVLEAARGYLALGLSVIPIPRPDGARFDGKVPSVAWREYQDRHPTDAELVAWFSGEPMNLAIVTGSVSGVVVVDADSREAARWCTRSLPYTPWQSKTPRGWHLYYRHPGVRVGNRARVETNDGRLAVDLRADGGFVVAAPSVHASGVQYAKNGDWSVPRRDLPAFWPGWLQRRKPPSVTAPVTRPSGDVVVRAQAYLSAIPRPEIGCGSDAAVLYAACRLVRGFALTEGEAVALLWKWAGGRPGWSHQWIAEKVRHAQRYGVEPIGALR